LLQSHVNQFQDPYVNTDPPRLYCTIRLVVARSVGCRNRSWVNEHSRSMVYNTVVLPPTAHGSEARTIAWRAFSSLQYPPTTDHHSLSPTHLSLTLHSSAPNRPQQPPLKANQASEALSPSKPHQSSSCGNLVAMAISTMKRNSSRQVNLPPSAQNIS
jgi:hypothetical protein